MRYFAFDQLTLIHTYCWQVGNKNNNNSTYKWQVKELSNHMLSNNIYMYVCVHTCIYTLAYTDYSYLIRFLLIRKQQNDLRNV